MQDDVRQLLAAIKETAEAEKAEIRASAEGEIAKISENTEARIKQFNDDALSRLDVQLRLESETILGKAQLEIRDRLIEVKNEIIREVFELAVRQIAALADSEKYKEIFKRLITEAIDKINPSTSLRTCPEPVESTGRKDIYLRISKTDKLLFESLKGDLPGPISAVFCDSLKGTVIVEIDGGRQSIDNSIETRLKMAQALMRHQLAEILFDTETSGEKDK
jgi:vacuolar-type H+-ATPase subunit E/Vma4